MLFLPRQKLEDVGHLHDALANAIKLELSTIPPYLTALFSVKPGCNADPAAIVRSVAIEEMLHLSLACNILNAIGGQPDLPSAVIRYPSELPMHIGDEPGRPFVVPLAKLSQASIKTFLTIEEPEDRLVFRNAEILAAVATDYHTIGEFYMAVAQLMRELGEPIFTGHKDRQVEGWIGTHRLFRIRGLEDALAAIKLIVDQGEGTKTSPAADPEELAHFYRFEQIRRGKTLVPDPTAPNGYVWGKPPVVLDEAGVWPMIDNPPLVPLPAGSPLARASDQFDGTYTALIDDLQRTFDGTPKALGSALAQMHALRLEAQMLMPVPVPGRTGTAGPRFLYRGTPPVS